MLVRAYGRRLLASDITRWGYARTRDGVVHDGNLPAIIRCGCLLLVWV